MKKLKLRAIELGASEILSREQMKKVLGGDDGSGGSTSGSVSCSTSSCTLTESINGSYVTWSGTCASFTYDSPGASNKCYCAAGSNFAPGASGSLSTNGGVSKCTL